VKPMTDKEYQAREDAHTLKRHAELVAAPSRHNAAKAHVKKEVVTLQKIVSPSKPTVKRK
jgi:hypothetical protein